MNKGEGVHPVKKKKRGRAYTETYISDTGGDVIFFF